MTLQKLLLSACVVLTLVLPLDYVGSIDIAGATLRSGHLVGLLLVLGGVVWLCRNNVALWLPKWWWFGVLFIGFAFWSVSWSPLPSRALAVTCFTGFVMLIGWMLPQVVVRKEWLWRLVAVWLTVALLACVFGLWQFVGDGIGVSRTLTGLREHYTASVFGFPRVQSTFMEPLYFGAFLLGPLSVVVSLLLWAPKGLVMAVEARSWWWRLFADALTPFRLWVLLAFGGLNLLLTLSRGAYAGVLVTLLIVGLLARKIILSRPQLVLGGVGLVMGMLLLVVGMLQWTGKGIDGDVLLQRFIGQAQTYNTGVGFDERATTVQAAYTFWTTHWVRGIGFGQFGPMITPATYSVPVTGWPIVNNETLEILAELGVVGLGLVLGFAGGFGLALVRAAHRVRTTDRALYGLLVGIGASFVGLVLQYQTFSTLYILPVWWLIGLACSAIRIAFFTRNS